MRRTPFPKPGCYTSTYPSAQWQEVPCSTAAARPHILPATGPTPHTVGGGDSGDVSAQVSGSLSQVIGSFDSATASGPNSYSLQLNTNTFPPVPSTLCDNPNCYAWQQYIYDSPGNVYIQYWLVYHGSSCPSQTIAGHTWSYYKGAGLPGCFINGHQTPVPSQAITELAALILTAKTGSQQSAVLETGSGTQYGTPDSGDFLGIGTQWNTAEFNVFGECCGSLAQFNTGSTIVVRTSVDNGTTTAPSYPLTSFTAETNSLTLVQPPCPIGGASPAVVFTESNAAGATSTCACPAGATWNPDSETCDFPCSGATCGQAQVSSDCNFEIFPPGYPYPVGATSLGGLNKYWYTANMETITLTWPVSFSPNPPAPLPVIQFNGSSLPFFQGSAASFSPTGANGKGGNSYVIGGPGVAGGAPAGSVQNIRICTASPTGGVPICGDSSVTIASCCVALTCDCGGIQPDGCGGTTNCGACSGSDICVGGLCECTTGPCKCAESGGTWLPIGGGKCVHVPPTCGGKLPACQ